MDLLNISLLSIILILNTHFRITSSLSYPYNQLSPCLCEKCLKETTVGIIIEDDGCYYISMNDILYNNNTYVKQLSHRAAKLDTFMARVLKDVNLADAIYSQLAAEAFRKFRVPLINFGLAESRYFQFAESHKVKRNDSEGRCLQLNTEKDFIVYEYEQCSPEVSILKTWNFALLARDNRYGLHPRYENTSGEFSFKKCGNIVNSALINGQCFFLSSETARCQIVEIAEVTSPKTFALIEQFVVGHFVYSSMERCKTLENYTQCLLTGTSPFKTFVIYIASKKIFKFGSTNYFAISDNRTGYYLGDVSKRRMTFLSAFQNFSSDYIGETTRLCIFVPPTTTQIIPYSIVVVEEIHTLSTVNITSELEEVETSAKLRNKANVMIFVLTSVMTIIGIVTIFVYKFWDEITERVTCFRHDYSI